MQGTEQTTVEKPVTAAGELSAAASAARSPQSFEPTERSRVRRLPKRAAYDRETVYAILDAGLVAHVAFVHDGEPFVIPMAYARMGDSIVLHGAKKARILETIVGSRICLNVAMVDGLVLARSAFHHSVNYRSVVILGTAVEVVDEAEKLMALEAISEHIIRGRWREVRAPTPQELKATTVVRMPIEEASAKVRTGPPVDDEEDYAIGCWAGELPLRLVAQAPVAEPRLAPGILPPAYVTGYRRPHR